MSIAERPVLLVGGIPGDSAEEILRMAGPAIGDLAIGLSDGEFGPRRGWVFFVVVNLWLKNKQLELSQPPAGRPGEPDIVPGALKAPAGYHDLPRFSLREGIYELSAEGLSTGYPDQAIASYKVFRELRDEGVIPQGVRFQQCIPFPDDAARLFAVDADTMDRMVDVYIQVVRNDIAKICESIPHDDLMLQWDINWETVAIDHGDCLPDKPPMHFQPNAPVVERYIRFLRELNGCVPDAVKLGLHLCYGDYGNTHFLEPTDLSTSVLMANTAVRESPRSIDGCHMSVPIDRDDDAYFEPLKDLDIGDTPVYAGLIHYRDGVEGSLRRLEAFKRHYSGPTGITTECGLGRRPPEEGIQKWFEIHREVAGHI